MSDIDTLKLLVFNFICKYPNYMSDLDTLFHAITAGANDLVVQILDFMDDNNMNSRNVTPTSTLYFKPFVTPLMLACLLNNFELVKILRARGHKMDVPHRADCICEKCYLERKDGEDTTDMEKRFASYRSIASEAYLFQDDGDDPILDAFLLSREFEKCKELERLFEADYEKLYLATNKVSASVIAECTNNDQVLSILKNTIGSSTECLIALPRLRIALDVHNKEFIAESKCQNLLNKEWLGSWADWYLVEQYQRSFRILSHTLFFPITSLLFVLSMGTFPSSGRIPFARFLSSVSAHFSIMLCLIINIRYKEPRDHRGPPDSLLKQILFGYYWLYVFGDGAVIITSLWRLGFRRFLDVWWHWFDLLAFLLNMMSFYAFCLAWAEVKMDGIRNAHRSHWSPTDSTLIFEVLYAPSIILFVLRMWTFWQLSRTIGPTIISIFRSVERLLRYLVVMFIFMISFAFGLNYLYEHYKYNSVVRNGKTLFQPNIFSHSVTYAMRNLYWSIFGYVPPDKLDVVVGNSGPDNSETSHAVIAFGGNVIMGTFYMIVVTLLLNLMISMMTRTAALILLHEDLNWKYICTHVRVEYFDDFRSVPAPFCLLQLFLNGLIFLVRKISGSRKENILSVWDWHYVDPEFSQSDYVQYVVRKLPNIFSAVLSEIGDKFCV